MRGLLITSPDLVAVALAGFSVGPMILLLVGHFSSVLVILTGAAGTVGALWLRGVEVEVPDHRALAFTALALAVVLVWLLINARYTAQSVYATRDPATYDITARWLTDHTSLHIATHPEIFGGPSCSLSSRQPCVSNGSPGFGTVDSAQVYAQGNHLMPAYVAVASWMLGVQGLFHANLVLGGAALFVFFGLVRRVAGAPLAVLAMSALAVSMPMIYVSRDTFSEPLTMLFLIGGLGLLHRAIGTRRIGDFALAGFVVGCSAMVRVDSYAALLAIILATIVLTGVGGPGVRKPAVVRCLVLISGCAIPATLGWLDVTSLSYGYYRDQRQDILLEFAGALILVVVGLAVVALLWLPSVRSSLSSERARRFVAVSMIGGLVLGFAILLSRPLWAHTHGALDNPHLAIWQAASHVTVDGTLLYNETALNEVGAYFGWVTVVLAVIGYAVLVRAMVLHRDYAVVGIVGMGLTMSAFYLWNWNIIPDQPWAMRRFVPVVAPAMLLAAAVGLACLRTAVPRGAIAKHLAGTALILLSIAMVAVPALVTEPVMTTRAQVPQYRQVHALCKAIGTRGAVVEVDGGAQRGYEQTMRSYCGVPSIGFIGATRAQLAAMCANAARHHRELFAMAQNRAMIAPAPDSSNVPFSLVTAQRWPNVIGYPPRAKSNLRTAIYLARVGALGQLVPIGQR